MAYYDIRNCSSSKDQPVTVGTKFGWVLAGSVNMFQEVSFPV